MHTCTNHTKSWVYNVSISIYVVLKKKRYKDMRCVSRMWARPQHLLRAPVVVVVVVVVVVGSPIATKKIKKICFTLWTIDAVYAINRHVNHQSDVKINSRFSHVRPVKPSMQTHSQLPTLFSQTPLLHGLLAQLSSATTTAAWRHNTIYRQ